MSRWVIARSVAHLFGKIVDGWDETGHQRQRLLDDRTESWRASDERLGEGAVGAVPESSPPSGLGLPVSIVSSKLEALRDKSKTLYVST